MKTYFNITKIADMPVLPPSQNRNRQMSEEGVFFGGENEEFGNTNKTKMKGIAEEHGIEPPVLPFAILGKPEKVNPKFIVNLDGKDYFFFDYKKPGKKTPGWVKMIDLSTGQEVTMGDDILSRIEEISESRRQELVEKANASIGRLNQRIEKWKKISLNVTSLPLVISRAIKTVDKRLQTINAQLSNIGEQGDPAPFETTGWEGYQDDIRDALQRGTYTDNSGQEIPISPQDGADTLLFLYQGNAQELLDDLNGQSIGVHPSLLSKIESYIRASATQGAQDARSNTFNKQDYQERQMEDANDPNAYTPDFTSKPIPSFDESMLPKGFINKMQKYKSPNAFDSQRKAIGISSDVEKQILTSSRDNLQVMTKEIAGNGGRLTLDWLQSTDGAGMVRSMKNYLQGAQGFLRKYQGDVAGPEGINPRLFGNKGTMANIQVIIELGVAFMAVKNALQQIESPVIAKSRERIKMGLQEYYSVFKAADSSLWDDEENFDLEDSFGEDPVSEIENELGSDVRELDVTDKHYVGQNEIGQWCVMDVDTDEPVSPAHCFNSVEKAHAALQDIDDQPFLEDEEEQSIDAETNKWLRRNGPSAA